MKKKFNKIIGILGGMGPFATLDIYKELLNCIEVNREWEFPHVIITSNPQMPSRTRAFLYGEENPIPYIIKEALRLEKAGADFIIVPCNSAHFFLDRVRKVISIDILDMMEITSEYVKSKVPEIKRVGVLAGEVPLEAGLYDNALKKRGIDTLRPDEKERIVIRAVIDMIKHNSIDRELCKEIENVVRRMMRHGAEAIILGCTELPILFRELRAIIEIIDPNKVLVERALEKALG